MLAAIIGTTAGFMPGLTQAPGMLAFLFLAAVILNANLALLGVCLLTAAILSFPLLPVTFRAGQFLLEGPSQEFFAALVNAPVLAFFGFEYYVTTGGLVLGLIVGIVFGLLAIRAVQGFRRKMAGLEEGSETWNRWRKNFLVRAFVFIFVGGGHGKSTYQDLLEKKGGFFRPLGLIFAALVLVVGFVVTLFASDSIVKFVLQTGLERANGATVDLEGANLKLGEGSLVLTGLAMADPNALETDLFRADTIEADLAQTDLLRKRMHIETMRIRGATSGETRATPGIRYRKPEPLPPPAPEEGEGKTLDDYLREAEKWRARIEQIGEWLERFSGPEEPAEPAPGEAPPEETEEKRMRRILDDGYRKAVASHLVRESPLLRISKATAEEMRVTRLPGETVTVTAENLSTHPRLVDKAPRVSVESSGGTLLADVEAGALSAASGVNSLELVLRGLPVDKIADDLKVAGERPLQGGTVDFQTAGSWGAGGIEFPIEVALRETQLTIPKVGETTVQELIVPIGLSGSFRRPRVHFSGADFSDALAEAGKAELAKRLREETGGLREKARERIGEELGEEAAEEIRGILDGLRRK